MAYDFTIAIELNNKIAIEIRKDYRIMEIMKSIQDRCSTRKFEQQQIKEKELKLVLEAARMAPSGMNERASRIFVIQNPDIMQQLNQVTANAIRNGNAEGISVEAAKSMKMNDYSISYHAPTFLLITHVKDSYNAFTNAGCLLENAMLQANELGLGSCWINIVRRTQNDPEVKEFLKKIGVNDDEIVTGGLAIGYPAAPFRKNQKTDGNEIIYI